MQNFDSFTKCLFTKRSLSLCKLPLAEIINDEEEGPFRRLLSFCSFYRPNRMQPPLNTSFEFSSAHLFLCQCLYFFTLLFLSLLHTFLSHPPTYYHRSLISDLPVRYQITPGPVCRVQSGTVLLPHFRSLLSVPFHEHQRLSFIH